MNLPTSRVTNYPSHPQRLGHADYLRVCIDRPQFGFEFLFQVCQIDAGLVGGGLFNMHDDLKPFATKHRFAEGFLVKRSAGMKTGRQ